MGFVFPSFNFRKLVSYVNTTIKLLITQYRYYNIGVIMDFPFLSVITAAMGLIWDYPAYLCTLSKTTVKVAIYYIIFILLLRS